MMIGPLRRITAAVGLLALIPITWLVATGSLTPEEAAIRAIIVAVVVVVIGNVLRTILIRMLRHIERREAVRSDAAEWREDPSMSDGSG